MKWGHRCYKVAVCSFLLLFLPLSQQLKYLYERNLRQGTCKADFLYSYEGFETNISHCAEECSRKVECKSFSVQATLDECRLYSEMVTADEILSTSASQQRTFFTATRTGPCPYEKGYVTVPGTEKCLRLETGPQNWAAAEAACEAEGGHLLVLEDLATWEAVRVFLKASISGVMTYVGGLRTSTGEWVWVDGRPLGSHLWKPGEPNDSPGSDNCVEVSTDPWGTPILPLNDLSCEEICQFVCEV